METIVYSKEQCPFCVKAIDMLTEKGVDFKVFKLGQDLEKEDMVALVKEKTGIEVTTVPQIFLNGEYIGGFTDLEKHYADQEVEQIDFSDMEL